MDLVMPPMPFSAVYVPVQGQRNTFIPEEMRNNSPTPSTTLALPAGVVQVIVTWRGTEGLNIWHARGSNAEITAVIPPSSTAQDRSTGVLTLVSETEHRMSVVGFSATWSQSTLDNDYVVGVQVMPMGTAADITGGGSLLRVDNSVGTRVFLGDQMIFGDTGVRVVTLSPTGSFIRMRRVGSLVEVAYHLNPEEPGEVGNQVLSFNLPHGFRPHIVARGLYGEQGSSPSKLTAVAPGGSITLYTSRDTSRSADSMVFTYSTINNWPTTLPGTSL